MGNHGACSWGSRRIVHACIDSGSDYNVLMDRNIVRDSLDALGLSAADFAKLVSVTPRAVSLWLASQREIPGPVRAYLRLLLSIPMRMRQVEIEGVLNERKETMRPYKYRFMLWQLISACDTGKYDSLSIDEVQRHANSGTIASFMIDTFDTHCDFSIFEPSDWTIIGETWGNIANAIDPSRKFGVDNKGICLLMAYALESQQMLESETAR